MNTIQRLQFWRHISMMSWLTYLLTYLLSLLCCAVLLQTVVTSDACTDSASNHVDYSPSTSSLPVALPCQRDVTPMTSAMTSSARCSSVGRSTSLPNVVVYDDHRHRRTVASANPPLRFYSGSLRHKDSILLRKSKLRQIQLRPSVERRPGDGVKINNVAVRVIDAPGRHSNDDVFDRSNLGPSRNRGESEVDQGHTGVIAPWTGGPWLPELRERNCREPTSSRLPSRRACGGNDDRRFHSSSSNKLTVILSAVDLAYHAPFGYECRTTMDVRCLRGAGWRCHGVATAQYLHVQPQSVADTGRLRKYPDRTCWSRDSELDEERFYADDGAGATSSSPSPEPFTRHGAGNSSAGDVDGSTSGHRVGAPVVMTSQHRVYALARAYSDRLKQLQRRSTTNQHADDFDNTGDLRVPVHRARARSASVGRRLPVSSSPALLYN